MFCSGLFLIFFTKKKALCFIVVSQINLWAKFYFSDFTHYSKKCEGLRLVSYDFCSLQKTFLIFVHKKINILLFPYGKVIPLANFLLETRITNQTFTNSFDYCCFNTLKAALLTYVTSPIQKEITKIFALFILNFLGYEKYKSFDVTKLIFVLPTFRLIQQSLSRITC